MIRTITPAVAAGLALATAAPALADHHEETKAEVVERNEKGHATKVKVGEYVYAVCTPESQDSCINPREAGLNFGSTPLDHWPGAPASGLTAQEKMRTAEENAAAKAEAEAAEQAPVAEAAE
ncbi:hypothetical protein [Croceicoccus bisphenolivorans]|uniref:hypothetical protein n=1 Tax=Croceicoccus bisphenolivorans TaxID=1783232 RepID=UPI000835B5D5|nr:hypothetical protein [Croceicoccus bisphenolivorans]